jgi:hypothetical protein
VLDLAFFLGPVVETGEDVSCVEFVEAGAHACYFGEGFVDLVCGVCPGGGEDVHFDEGVAAVGYQGVEFLCGGGDELRVRLGGVVGVGLAVREVQVCSVAGGHREGRATDGRTQEGAGWINEVGGE